MEFKIKIISRSVPFITRALVVQKKGTGLELLWLKPDASSPLPVGSDLSEAADASNFCMLKVKMGKTTWHSHCALKRDMIRHHPRPQHPHRCSPALSGLWLFPLPAKGTGICCLEHCAAVLRPSATQGNELFGGALGPDSAEPHGSACPPAKAAILQASLPALIFVISASVRC